MLITEPGIIEIARTLIRPTPTVRYARRISSLIKADGVVVYEIDQNIYKYCHLAHHQWEVIRGMCIGAKVVEPKPNQQNS